MEKGLSTNEELIEFNYWNNYLIINHEDEVKHVRRLIDCFSLMSDVKEEELSFVGDGYDQSPNILWTLFLRRKLGSDPKDKPRGGNYR